MDMDDLDALLLGLPKPSSGTGKTPMKGPEKEDSLGGGGRGGGLRAAGKPAAAEKEPPLHAVAPVRRRPSVTFEDDGDDFLDALGLGSGPERKREATQPALSKLEKPGMGEQELKLDEKSQKQPGNEEGWDKEDFVFGAYQPSVASLPKGQLSRRQSVSRFSAETSSEPKAEPCSKPPTSATLRPQRRNRSGGDYLGLKDELSFDCEAVDKPDPPEEDWLATLLSGKKAQAEEKAEERNAKALEGSGKGLDPRSPVSQPATSPGGPQQAAALQDKAASTSGSGQPVPWLSTTPPASSQAPEAVKEDPSRDASGLASFPREQKLQGPAALAQVTSPTAHLPAAPQLEAEAPALGVLREGRPWAPPAHLHEEALGCQAALLSAQARVAELESQVRVLEEERTQEKLLLQRLQQWHREEMDLLESSYRNRMKMLEESYGQREEMLRRVKEQLEAQLLVQSQEVERVRAELKQRNMLELERAGELQRASVQDMQKDHEELLRWLRRLKDQEMEAVTSTTSCSRSLNSILERIEKFFSEQRDFSQQMEAAQRSASQKLATEAQQQDKQLQELQDRLWQQQREMEVERRRFQEVVVQMESRLSKQSRLLEEERGRVAAVESLQRSLEEQRQALTRQLSTERAELERTKEQTEMKIRSQELEAKAEQLARDRELLEETKQDLRLEKEKVDRATLHIWQREEEVKNMLKERLSLAQQRRQLQELREELVLAMEQDLRAPSKGLSSTWAPSRTAAPHSWACLPDFPPAARLLPQSSLGGSREALAMASPTQLSIQTLLLLHHRAQQDHMFLEDEQLFLETLKKAS